MVEAIIKDAGITQRDRRIQLPKATPPHLLPRLGRAESVNGLFR
jgi:hypothetical protein